MSESKSNTIIILFGKEIVIPKSVVWGFISAIVIGTLSLSFAFIKTTAQTNKEFPDEQRKQIEVDKKANDLRIDVEVIKTDMSNVKKNCTDMNTKIDKQTDILIQLLKDSKQIKENTK
jgi:hypothetical protein